MSTDCRPIFVNIESTTYRTSCIVTDVSGAVAIKSFVHLALRVQELEVVVLSKDLDRVVEQRIAFVLVVLCSGLKSSSRTF